MLEKILGVMEGDCPDPKCIDPLFPHTVLDDKGYCNVCHRHWRWVYAGNDPIFGPMKVPVGYLDAKTIS